MILQQITESSSDRLSKNNQPNGSSFLRPAKKKKHFNFDYFLPDTYHT